MNWLNKIISRQSNSAKNKDAAIAIEIDGDRITAVSFTHDKNSIKLLCSAVVFMNESELLPSEIVNQENVARKLEKVLAKVGYNLPVSSNEIILSLPGESVHNVLVHGKYERSNPRAKIDLTELKNLIYKIEWKSFDRMRRLLDVKSGGRDKDVRLLNSEIVNLEIDGHTVANPLGMSGSKIIISAISTFVQTDYLEAFANILGELGYDLVSAQAAPIALGKIIKDESAVVINIRRERTDVILMLDGKVLGFRTFNLGTDAFLKKVIYGLGVTDDVASALLNEQVDEGSAKLSSQAIQARESLEEINAVWLDGFKLALQEVAANLELPSQFYIACDDPSGVVIRLALGRASWRRGLSFEGRLQINELSTDSLELIREDSSFNRAGLSVSLAGLISLVHDAEGPNVVEEVLSRVAKIMQ